MATLSAVGQFQIEEYLGSGTYADVYRAKDTVRRRKVALKVLTERLAGEQAVLRFLQQAELASDLIHPHLAWVWETGQMDGSSYVAERFVDGPSLARMVADSGPLHWKQALQIIRDVAQGLDFAHERKWVHGNLRPKNILVSPDLGAVLTDLGLSKALQDSLSTGSSRPLTNASRYSAPELWQGGAPSPASDLYALACVLFEILTGQVLFDAPTLPEIKAKHQAPLHLPPLWPVGVPWQINTVLERALAKDPSERYPNAGEFVVALEGLASSRIENPEERAQRAAQEQAWLEAQETARQQAEESLRQAALEQARREMDEQFKHAAQESLLLSEPLASGAVEGAEPAPEPEPASQAEIGTASRQTEAPEAQAETEPTHEAASPASTGRAGRPPSRQSRWPLWVALGVLLIVLGGFIVDSRLGALFPDAPTSTPTPVTPSATLPPTLTSTGTPTMTATFTATPSPTATTTLTPTLTLTSTATGTATITPTKTPTIKPTAVSRDDRSSASRRRH